MIDAVGDRLLFPAPTPTYRAGSYRRHLCWLPWSDVISPERPTRSGEPTKGVPALWFPASHAATVLVFFHANAEDLGMSYLALKHMRDQFKVNVLGVEYPGYGLLADMYPSEEGVFQVALTALRFLVDELKVLYSQIILFGRSLGSGPAVHLAAQYPVGGLILVSPFVSVRMVIQSIAGQMVAMGFKERFMNLRVMGNVSCSTLFIHGDEDTLVPPEHTLKLFERCRARKLMVMPNVGHNFNLFSDPKYVAIPAINFFGFPGYSTSEPPKMPVRLFETSPEDRSMENPPTRVSGSNVNESELLPPWLCDLFLQANDRGLCIDASVCCRKQGVRMEDANDAVPEEMHEDDETPMPPPGTPPAQTKSHYAGDDSDALPELSGSPGYAVGNKKSQPSRPPKPKAAWVRPSQQMLEESIPMDDVVPRDQGSRLCPELPEDVPARPSRPSRPVESPPRPSPLGREMTNEIAARESTDVIPWVCADDGTPARDKSDEIPGRSPGAEFLEREREEATALWEPRPEEGGARGAQRDEAGSQRDAERSFEFVTF